MKNDEIMKYLETELKVRADSLAEYLVANDQLESPSADGIVCETWIVSSDLATRLKEMGEVVHEAFGNYYWFKYSTGMALSSDKGFIKKLVATWR